MKSSEYGWLIEKGSIGQPEYVTLTDGIGWTEPGDHLKALRFEREEDAEAFVSAFIVGTGSVDRKDIRVAEHGWG